MLHVGLDLSRRRLDICLLDEHGEVLVETAVPPDADGLRGLARCAGMHAPAVRAVIVSMNARGRARHARRARLGGVDRREGFKKCRFMLQLGGIPG
jgi:predicted NBD/HSP70 family sugar kinase